jgi:hypothetical protein
MEENNGADAKARLDKIEFVVSGHIEQARKDYEENRRLWREQQADIAAIWIRMDRRDAEWDRRFEAMRTEADARARELDRRVGDLVSAIGSLIRRIEGGNGTT